MSSKNWYCVYWEFQFHLRLNLDTPKYVCPESLYQFRKQPVLTTCINLAENQRLTETGSFMDDSFKYTQNFDSKTGICRVFETEFALS